jgi:uncharacterized membrane protein
VVTGDVLLWSIPLIILAVAMLGMRRYSPLNLARHAGGMVIVLATLALGTSAVLEPPVLIFLGAIGGTLVGQAYEAEKRRAADRIHSLDTDAIVAATPG